MNKTLYLTYYWPPAGGPGVQRSLKFAKYLPGEGIEPIILTVDENKASYPLEDLTLLNDIDKNLRVFKTSSFEPLDWYKKLNRKKEIPFSGYVNQNKRSLSQKIFRFIRGNFFIPDARVGWNSHAYKKARYLLENEKFNAVITTSPPHSTQLVGLILKKKFHIPWIADIRDPWTDIYYFKDFYSLPFALKKNIILEKKVLENADAIVVTSQATKDLFVQKSKHISAEKVYVIPNGYDEDDFKGLSSEPDQSRLVITYTGTIAEQYNITAFLDAVSVFRSRHPDFPIRIRFVGAVSIEIRARIKEKKLEPLVEYIDYVTHPESIRFLLKSTALLLVVPQILDRKSVIIPGKLFEYLAARKNIVCIGPKACDASTIVEACGSGKGFDYNDKEGILNYLEELKTKWVQNYNMDIQNEEYKTYSRKNLTHAFASVINNTISKFNP